MNNDLKDVAGLVGFICVVCVTVPPAITLGVLLAGRVAALFGIKL